MRIIRSVALLVVIAILMPSPPERDSHARQAASAASLCPEGSGLCETAAYLADQFQAKALYSAGIVYEWAVDATLGPGAAGTLEARAAAPGAQTASLAALAAPPPGRSTLRLDDLIPEWRGPVSRPKEEG